MNGATQTQPPGFVAYAPARRSPMSYSQLIATYGEPAFSKACELAKTSPLSVQEILERPHLFSQPKQNAK